MGPVVATESGPVEGFREEDISVFLGIPYAEAPVGEHRFLAPAPRKPWDGVRPALEYSGTAPQPRSDFTIIPEPVIDEDDCLTLNIFTPDPGAAGLPVLVWIHGGGFVTGCSASPWYRGNRFARDGVVLVSVNYRLGTEGFLPLDGAPDNRGARDWVAGLEWVQRNIAGFGGDPAQVTIGGQSAGGAACLALMTMPSAAGLFRAAIPMSGAAVPPGGDEARRKWAQEMATHLGCRPVREEMARVGTEDMIAAQVAVTGGGMNGPGLWIDGDVLPGDPVAAIGAGTGADLPILVGATEDEAIPALIGAADRIDADRFVRRMGRLGLDEEAAGAYRSMLGDLPLWRVLARATTDLRFRLTADRLADTHSGAGAARRSVAGRTFAYDFRWPSPALGGFGAAHCLDLPFVFDNLDAYWVDTVAGPDTPQELADRMHRAWVSFIADGDPGWAPYESEHRRVMVFDAADGPVNGVADDPLSASRDIWAQARARSRS